MPSCARRRRFLAESAARDERTPHLANELHDAWGHDLLRSASSSKVCANLVAPERVDGQASSRPATLPDPAQRRSATSSATLRRYEGHDLKPVLEALATGAPGLAVHLDISETLALPRSCWRLPRRRRRCVQPVKSSAYTLHFTPARAISGLRSEAKTAGCAS